MQHPAPRVLPRIAGIALQSIGLGDLVQLRRATGALAELTDEAVLSAVGSGDAAALAALYVRFHRELYGFLARLLGSYGPEVDDLVQTTFLEARRAAHRFKRKSSVKTWLFAVGANLVRQHIRDEMRRRRAMSGLAAVPVAPQEQPDAQAERAELMRRLSAAIDRLPYAQRVAYVMCVIEEVPGKEAAHTLGIRASSLWRRLHDARKSLRGLIESGAP